MIVVTVALHSAVSGQATELARMEIANDGERSMENVNRGNYIVRTLKGRSTAALNRRTTQRSSFVRNHARLAEHVWNLVAKALKALQYGDVDKCNSTSTLPTARTSSASPERTAT